MGKRVLPALLALLLALTLLGGCAYFGKGVEIVIRDWSPERELPEAQTEEETAYVLNTKSRKFHLPECESVQDIQPGNREDYTGTRAALIEEGYSPCKRCNP